MIHAHSLVCRQAFPYFYVPYGNDLPTDPSEGETLCRVLLPAPQTQQQLVVYNT